MNWDQQQLLFPIMKPTHIQLWDLMEVLPGDEEYDNSLIGKGLAFRDREGRVWLINCWHFWTEEQYQRFIVSSMSNEYYGIDIEIIELGEK